MAKTNTKQMMKRVQAKIVPALERGAGALGAAYLHNKMEDLVPQLDKKYGGAILMLAGVAAEVIFEKNAHISAIAQGVTTYGTMRTVVDLAMPDQSANFGLAGPGYSTQFEAAQELPITDFTEMEGLGEFEEEEFGVEQFNIPDQNIMPGLSPAANPISNAIQRAPGSPQGIQGTEEDDDIASQFIEGMVN